MSNAKTDAAMKTSPREVLFFELEFVATTGRDALFNAVKKALAAQGVEVTPVSFSRAGTALRLEQLIAALLAGAGKTNVPVEEICAQVAADQKKFFEESAQLNKSLPALISEAKARNIEAVAVSPYTKEIAGALMTRLGLDTLGVSLEAFNNTDPLFPRADHWLRMLKTRNQDTLPLISIVSSQIACKGALTAGATCVAVPDAYTGFEDFSGAMIVLETLGGMPAKEIIGMVTRR